MKKQSRGLTLIELIVVVAILAVLAMIVVPKLDGITNNTNHAVGATSASDTSRYIQTFLTMKRLFPDNWDSLMSGNDLWNAANPGTVPVTRGLHIQLGGSTGKLMADKLSAAEVLGLKSVGIYNFMNVNTSAAASVRPGDMFTQRTPLVDDNPAAFVNPNSAGGRKIIDHVYRQNLQTDSTGTLITVSGTLPSGRRLLAVGFGPQNKLIGTLMLEAPSYPNVDQALVYGRNLVLFEVGGSKAIFKGVLGSDGDLLDDLTTYMSRDIQ